MLYQAVVSVLAPLLASYYGQLPVVGGVFHCDDPSISHTYTGDTVTARALFSHILLTVIPLVNKLHQKLP